MRPRRAAARGGVGKRVRTGDGAGPLREFDPHLQLAQAGAQYPGRKRGGLVVTASHCLTRVFELVFDDRRLSRCDLFGVRTQLGVFGLRADHRRLGGVRAHSAADGEWHGEDGEPVPAAWAAVREKSHGGTGALVLHEGVDHADNRSP